LKNDRYQKLAKKLSKVRTKVRFGESQEANILNYKAAIVRRIGSSSAEREWPFAGIDDRHIEGQFESLRPPAESAEPAKRAPTARAEH